MDARHTLASLLYWVFNVFMHLNSIFQIFDGKTVQGPFLQYPVNFQLTLTDRMQPVNFNWTL